MTLYITEMYDLPGTDRIHKCEFYFGNYPEITRADIKILYNFLKNIRMIIVRLIGGLGNQLFQH